MTHRHAHGAGHAPGGGVEAHGHGHGHGDEGEAPHVHEHEHEHGHEHTHRLPDGRTVTHRHPHTHKHEHEHGHGEDADHGHPPDQVHQDDPHHDHEHDPDELRARRHRAADGLVVPDRDGGAVLALEEAILGKNDALAQDNRRWLAQRGAYAVNVMSSPGAGKTTLLARTIRDLGDELPFAVVEGDQAMSFDAEKIRAAGAPVVQVNTGKGCHLEADMVARGLDVLDPPPGTCVVVENVGNLVCPALFDLGEHAKVVILSVTEGEDKPLKYPHMFRAADVVLLTKTDLLPHLDYDLDRCLADLARLRPGVTVLQVSARTGEGLDHWYRWLRAGRDQALAGVEVARIPHRGGAAHPASPGADPSPGARLESDAG
ncbi:MAG TPA: hydrogenase nickel incorporation protein HypB [Polyangiaceae bacterium LLY-WYZ-14_1]|nr:hydrogenase nickel incorporation protein HypB [Polyangiaceae bacterium LLY-WYZ-14_1]